MKSDHASTRIISVQEMLNEEKKLIDAEIDNLKHQKEELKNIWYEYYAWRE